jgi:hypothetical protein
MKAFNRLNKNGQQYFLTEVPGSEGIAVTSYGVTIWFNDCSIDQLIRAWHNWTVDGWNVHDAFPFLSFPQRRFLMTGITQEDLVD